MANRQQEVNAYERQLEALKLRLAGATYDTIAERLGYANRSGAFQSVMAALRKTLQEPADELRKMEIERLDRLWLQAYSQASHGHLGALDRCLRIMERRAKLLGLDAPVKQEVTGKDGGPLVVVNWDNVTTPDSED